MAVVAQLRVTSEGEVLSEEAGTVWPCPTVNERKGRVAVTWRSPQSPTPCRAPPHLLTPCAQGVSLTSASHSSPPSLCISAACPPNNVRGLAVARRPAVFF